MDERDKKEEQNKRIGWLTSVGVQLVLLILFYFIIAWREPFPPIPEYGIELGFTTSAGAPATSSPSQPAPVTNEEPVEQEEQTEAEVVQEEVVETTDNVQEETTVSEVESPVKVEESTPEESEPVEEEPEEVDSRAIMTPSEMELEKTSENPSEGEEEKEVDPRAIYGSQGTNERDAEGSSLSLAGWRWDREPKPNDTSSASGKIVYKIVVDSDGYLVKIETITSTVSQAVERKYRAAVEKLTFSKTADYKTAPVSTGTVTFIIKSK